MFKDGLQHLDGVNGCMLIRFADFHCLHDNLLQLFTHFIKVHTITLLFSTLTL